MTRIASWSATHFTGLWRHRDFLKLWGGQTVSLFGTFTSGFALSLTAIYLLGATATDVAWLSAARYAPGVVVGLFAGVVVDRLPRRSVLIAADIGRALLVAAIPLAAFAGRLTLAHLYVVSLLMSVLTVLFDVAYGAYLPSLVVQDALTEGNAKLGASAAIAEIGGFGLSGFLIAAFTAPGAMLVDALSFVVSAVSLGAIRVREPRRPRETTEGTTPVHLWAEIREGLVFVWRTPTLRALTGAAVIDALFGNVIGVVILLDWTERLSLSPVAMGLLSGVGGISALAGSLVVTGLVRRWGTTHTLWWSLLVRRVTGFSVALADGPYGVVIALLLVGQLFDGAMVVYEIVGTSVRQRVTPDVLLGRVNASVQCLGWAATLGGIALGGVLGGLIGTRLALLVGFTGTCLALLCLARVHFEPADALNVT